MPKVPYPYEVNGKSVTGNGFLIPICSLSNSSLLPSLTVSQKLHVCKDVLLSYSDSKFETIWFSYYFPNHHGMVEILSTH